MADDEARTPRSGTPKKIVVDASSWGGVSGTSLADEMEDLPEEERRQIALGSGIIMWAILILFGGISVLVALVSGSFPTKMIALLPGVVFALAYFGARSIRR